MDYNIYGFYKKPMKNKYLQNHIIDFLSKKMVFLGGARQVGKTTLSLKLLKPLN